MEGNGHETDWRDKEKDVMLKKKIIFFAVIFAQKKSTQWQTQETTSHHCWGSIHVYN